MKKTLFICLCLLLLTACTTNQSPSEQVTVSPTAYTINTNRGLSDTGRNTPRDALRNEASTTADTDEPSEGAPLDPMDERNKQNGCRLHYESGELLIDEALLEEEADALRQAFSKRRSKHSSEQADFDESLYLEIDGVRYLLATDGSGLLKDSSTQNTLRPSSAALEAIERICTAYGVPFSVNE